MKPAAFIYSLLFICLSAGGLSFGQSGSKPDEKKVCPFNIVGLWRSDATTQTSPIFFNFSPEGHVWLVAHSDEALPQDFEVIVSVDYKLDKPAEPKRIEFTAWRGNDVFLQGITSWKITEYSDNSFTTLDPVTEQKTLWVREQTHRYFLTLAARSGPPAHGGPAFAMWTMMDGRQTKIDALGIQLIKDEADKTVPLFGPIPAEVYDLVREESEEEKKRNKEENVIMRFEMSQKEFKTSHEIYEVWEKYVTTQKLPHGDPYMNVIEFLSKAVEGIDQCGEKIKLNKLTRTERDEIVARIKPPQQSLEYIRMMRKKNNEMHVSDLVFPWQWRPAIQMPAH